ncbi:hypothetical protein BCR39DRAFT_536852 [Naematelia encephala]|uniref:Short-chain dehydrogenase n=1 Tax=Naematelia encephala TaxID=71784 RepID=A0A1Y2AZC8_9TREE|nr:hypothetical protein BCR39DRAFT_536852 [Naematelia encephala]
MTISKPIPVASASALYSSVAGTGRLQVDSLFDVAGWVVVVTGGGTGLGLTTAIALAENGAKVYITGRRAEPLQAAAVERTEKGGAIIAIQADVGNKEGIKDFRSQLEAREKYINVLINNHGVSLGCADINACEQTPEGLSKQMFDGEDLDKWIETYRINTASYHFTTFALLPLLAAAKTVGNFPEPGNVVNLSSMSGITRTSQRGQFNYNASKAATILLSHMQAAEFARRGLGVRVNVVCPGYFPSGMTVIDPCNNTGSDAHSSEFRNKWGIPFGRPGNAVDYAQCIFGLITNQYVTGTELVIDGGWLLEAAF